ncbi:MAG TPA: metalloregulator ArsR/SmtB family transcription factor [Chloroflexota bacterium]|nr:metalloregulator ArsR/SmtB family transcription factor [Chloroflexota bacterium]
MQKQVKRRFKNNLFEQFARIGRALGNAHRIELLDVLAQGERPVEQLAAETDLTIANASQHLQVLRHAELVVSRREGTRVLYSLAGPEVFAMWQALRTAGEARLAEIERVIATYLADRAQMEEIGPEELRRRLEDGEVTLIDVRPAIESDKGRIAGALPIPVDELPARVAEIPTGRPIVAYCRGPYCVYADEAVAILRGQGRRAMRLTVGYPDWKAAGLPTEEASAVTVDGVAMHVGGRLGRRAGSVRG